MVAERRHDAAGGDADARLDHAAEHHAETERPRGVGHPDRLADASRLRELDVDPVGDLGAARHVGERVAVLVDVDRDRRARPQLLGAGIAGRERLLDVRDAELDELRDRVERLVERPPLVHVDLQRQVRARADRADALDIEAVAAAELQLQPLEPARDPLRAAGHVVGVAEPDRPRRRRADPRAARAGARPARRAAFPGGRGARRRAPPSPPARPGSRRAARRSPRARTGRRRAAPRAPRRTRAPTPASRRSGRSARPRRGRRASPCRSSTWTTSSQSRASRAITNVSARRRRAMEASTCTRGSLLAAPRSLGRVSEPRHDDGRYATVWAPPPPCHGLPAPRARAWKRGPSS